MANTIKTLTTLTVGKVGALVVILSFLPLAAHANTGFTDNFESGTISPNWTNAGNFSLGPDVHGVLPTQVVFPSSGASREYLRTVDADYITGDFTASVELSNECNGCGDILVFFGMGDGSNTAPNNEPNNGIFLRIHTDGVAGNRVDTAYDAGGGLNLIQQGFVNAVPDGAHKAFMDKTGNLLTFSFDVGNDGSIDATANPIDLTAAPTNFLNAANSGVFFGTGSVANTHALDNFSVTGPGLESAVPEPSTFSLAMLGLLWLGFAWRRRKRA